LPVDLAFGDVDIAALRGCASNFEVPRSEVPDEVIGSSPLAHIGRQ